MITLYLDMDGVLADFHKEYIKYDPEKSDRKRFRQSVLEHQIFENLDYMPDALALLKYVSNLEDIFHIKVEILTSMGTHDVEQGAAAAKQKQVWLDKHGITYKANFVRNKTEKSLYADQYSILIDDSIGCIKPFTAAGGHGILHTSTAETIPVLGETLLRIDKLELPDEHLLP